MKISSNPFVTLPDHLDDMYNTLMYGAEEGQFAGKPSRNQFIELFCYDIGLFTFNPDKNLNVFAQVRALIKTARWLGYDRDKTIALIKKNFPNEYEGSDFKNVKEKDEVLGPISNFINDVFGAKA